MLLGVRKTDPRPRRGDGRHKRMNRGPLPTAGKAAELRGSHRLGILGGIQNVVSRCMIATDLSSDIRKVFPKQHPAVGLHSQTASCCGFSLNKEVWREGVVNGTADGRGGGGGGTGTRAAALVLASVTSRPHKGVTWGYTFDWLERPAVVLQTQHKTLTRGYKLQTNQCVKE